MIFTINGTYGSHRTPCKVFVSGSQSYYGPMWYCVEGSMTVNRTWQDVADGVDTDALADFDCFTWSSPIATVEEFAEALEY